MEKLTVSALALDSSGVIADPLQYQSRLRFPGALESAYRWDFADRFVAMQRQFIIFGFLLYGSFAILDYYAMPRTHAVAWLLRLLVEPIAIALFIASYRPFFRRHMYWLLNLWMLVVNCSILVMIARAQQSELAFTFYPIGLMLVFICGYVASGHLGYATVQGWLAILGYFLVAILDQRMLVGIQSFLKFFTLAFFLVSMNLIGMALAYTLERSNRLAFLQRLVIEQQRRESDRLLLNILPASVAERLKRSEVVADHFDQVGILFADIQSFTPYSAGKRPAEVVQILNRIFSAFDSLTELYGLEKIKTIGDAYMVVSGLPSPRPDHLDALASMALDMQAVMQRLRGDEVGDLQLRIGIHAGPVVAGIIGLKKFSYDLWGDTVNVASRMESFGIPGEIQVTKDVYLLLKESYSFQKRGRVQIKGKGEMLAYLLKSGPALAQAEALDQELLRLQEGPA